MTKNKKEIIMPFAGDYRMTQKFGVFFWMDGRKLKHLGVDWALPKGTRVRACFNGVVSRVEKYRLNGYGRSVYIRSKDNKYDALCAHLSSIVVEVGDCVKAGDMVGTSGNTGFSVGKNGGYHLHFGLKLYGEYIDPLLLLNDKSQGGQLPLYEYIVKKGDTLSSISKAFYKDGNQWPKIFEANVDRVSNPDLIYPGQILRIPGLI